LHFLKISRCGELGVSFVQFVLQFVNFCPQHLQLFSGLFIGSQRRDCFEDLIWVDLRDKVGVNNDDVIFNTCDELLIDNQEKAGCIRADLIEGNIPVSNDGDAFQIDCDLLKRIAAGGLKCKIIGVALRIVVSHAMFALTRHQSAVGKGQAGLKQDQA
jgi:hypothetical protein